MQSGWKIWVANYTVIVICVKWLVCQYRSYENLINKNWVIIEKRSYKKQPTLVNLIVYFYLIIYFLLSPIYTNYVFSPKEFALSRDTRSDIGLTSNFQICSIGCSSFFYKNPVYWYSKSTLSIFLVVKFIRSWFVQFYYCHFFFDHTKSIT